MMQYVTYKHYYPVHTWILLNFIYYLFMSTKQFYMYVLYLFLFEPLVDFDSESIEMIVEPTNFALLCVVNPKDPGNKIRAYAIAEDSMEIDEIVGNDISTVTKVFINIYWINYYLVEYILICLHVSSHVYRSKFIHIHLRLEGPMNLIMPAFQT